MRANARCQSRMRPRSLMTMPSKVVAANSAKRSSLSPQGLFVADAPADIAQDDGEQRGPCTLIWEMEASTSKCLAIGPSAAHAARAHQLATGHPGAGEPANVFRMMLAGVLGSSASMGWPMASAADRPNIRSAAGLNSSMRWFSSTLMMPSMADSDQPRQELLAISRFRQRLLRLPQFFLQVFDGGRGLGLGFWLRMPPKAGLRIPAQSLLILPGMLDCHAFPSHLSGCLLPCQVWRGCETSPIRNAFGFFIRFRTAAI